MNFAQTIFNTCILQLPSASDHIRGNRLNPIEDLFRTFGETHAHNPFGALSHAFLRIRITTIRCEVLSGKPVDRRRVPGYKP